MLVSLATIALEHYFDQSMLCTIPQIRRVLIKHGFPAKYMSTFRQKEIQKFRFVCFLRDEHLKSV